MLERPPPNRTHDAASSPSNHHNGIPSDFIGCTLLSEWNDTDYRFSVPICDFNFLLNPLSVVNVHASNYEKAIHGPNLSIQCFTKFSIRLCTERIMFRNRVVPPSEEQSSFKEAFEAVILGVVLSAPHMA